MSVLENLTNIIFWIIQYQVPLRPVSEALNIDNLPELLTLLFKIQPNGKSFDDMVVTTDEWGVRLYHFTYKTKVATTFGLRKYKRVTVDTFSKYYLTDQITAILRRYGKKYFMKHFDIDFDIKDADVFEEAKLF